MKLIIKEYLASLKERNELDAILPDLLSELGLNVISRPGRGTRQNGVDVAAVGALDEDSQEKLYLFSIKSGNLTRNDWSSDSAQALRPSLDEIREVYVRNNISQEHRDKPIVICLCFGGEIKEQVRQQVTAYIDLYTREKIKFEEWNGDKLTNLILKSFLKEELMPESHRSNLRKSLALIDEPKTSFEHFTKLLDNISQIDRNNHKEILTSIRQMNICLWILYVWCRQQNNIESAYLSGERTALIAWELGKPYIDSQKKAAKKIQNALLNTLSTYNIISDNFAGKIILPHADKFHGLSSAVHASCHASVNIKMFDILGRLALTGVWNYWRVLNRKENDESRKKLIQIHEQYCNCIKLLINNNPILLTPLKDDQAIDIAMAIFLLSSNSSNLGFIETWINELLNSVIFSFQAHSFYPSNLFKFPDLIEHPKERTDNHRNSVTSGSILYPLISIISSLLGFDSIYAEVKKLKKDFLHHCNFQIWYPNTDSETNYYTNNLNHGSIQSDVPVEGDQKELLKEVFQECTATNYFDELSAVKYNTWPLIFTASRHYRVPIPLHFFKNLKQETSETE